MMPKDDPYNLGRFTAAQGEMVFERVLTELAAGQKLSHWMWFIFPQIEGLGESATSRFYSIKDVEEARQYLDHPVLGPRLLKCAEMLLAIQGRSASDIFGYPDDMKLRSSMTLFAHITDSHSVFAQVLEKYFNGQPDQMTLHLLGD
jgi:uncharacterized protein (DUF1810 family)